MNNYLGSLLVKTNGYYLEIAILIIIGILLILSIAMLTIIKRFKDK